MGSTSLLSGLGNFVGLATSVPGGAAVQNTVSGGGIAGALGITTTPIDPTASLLSGAPVTTGASSSSTSSAGTISQLFLRATVIILGMIFVAVGLSMFKPVAQYNAPAAKPSRIKKVAAAAEDVA